jgi:hypothetical protein
VRTSRVVIVGLPPLLRDIVASALDHAGVEVSYAQGPPAGNADVVVAGPEVEEPSTLLGRLPERVVIVLRDDGRRAELLEVAVRSSDLGEIDPKRLLDLVLLRGRAV